MKDNERELFSFSIFKMCDNDTNRLIVALAKLAKDRIFKVIQRQNPPSHPAHEESSNSSKNRSKKASSGMAKGSMMEQKFGYLYHNSYHYNKWLQFADKCCAK